ncbi:spondin domain-containing protein [Vibrio europaeus]|uniref:spondin domain-containing protein n=1 Tax=Vibrio europaeus TaxID=300876 RepID=UPI00233F2EAE|nr:spondin domain-containing protein [Vibrio europaeus]MDC5872176.1 spondin domain-containing protein [Vibrio europaeus]
MQLNKFTSKTVWMFLYALSLVACGDESNSSSNTSVSYVLTFTSNWNSANFPTNFPVNPHFSSLIGMTHNSSASLFKSGTLATAGLEEVAETGGTNTIKSEIGDIQNLGNSQSLIEGNGLPTGQTQVQVQFSVDTDFPLVSIVTMVAPSPDWFVGVDSLNLYQNGAWVDDLTVELKVYDSGTDDGVTFTSANVDSSPKTNVSLLTSNAADTDFLNGVHRTTSTHIGTFTFKRQ